MLRFYFPWLALLLPLPLIVWFLLPASRTRGEEGIALHFPHIERLKAAFPLYSSDRKTTRKTPLYLLSLFWFFLVLALMQPERANRFVQMHNKGYDLMLAVDVSGSMQALDLSSPSQVISRLDATKDVVGRFVLGRQGDRVGLVTFGESAYLHVPLTLDTLSVSKMLNDVVPGMAGNATAIGDAIGLSVRTLRERPEGSRILVLLTDGEDNASSISPMEAAKLAKQYGIKIYTIGIGSNGNVPFPSNFGGYRMVRVSLDEDLLKEIAAVTDGHYFSAVDLKGLEAIYQKIDALEKTESKENVFFIRQPLYRYPLAVAVVLLLSLVAYQLYRRRSYAFQ